MKAQRGIGHTIIVKMVIFLDSKIWSALLAACRVHEDKTQGIYGTQAFEIGT